MIALHRYRARSGVVHGPGRSGIGLATDTLREATFFRGTVGQPTLLREALAALYAVVVSDFKYRPRDRLEYRAWLEQQDQQFLARLAQQSLEARVKMESLQARLAELDASRLRRLQPFHEARLRYFEHVYTDEYELARLLDPVITVHPDEISFEAFSRDESTYARLAARFELFDHIGETLCGTTNIDFSTRLHGEIERMRSYRTTDLAITPDGLAVRGGGGAAVTEKKIDLPESWVHGFLQVHSTMSLALTHVAMTRGDLLEICRFLMSHRARTSPRALRFELRPGCRTRAVFEPWEHVIELSGGTVYDGPEPLVVRTWGRDRLRTLVRLIPRCKSLDVYLAGFGLPTIYVADLGPITFTAAFSGWTDNDWAGGARFHLLTRPATVDAAELTRVYDTLKQLRRAGDEELAAKTGLPVDAVRAALSFLCQVGRAMHDLAARTYRHRDLFLEPFSAREAASVLRPAAADVSAEEEAARRIFEAGNIRIIAQRPAGSGFKLSGSSKGKDGVRVRPLVHIDRDGRILDATCTCRAFDNHGLTRGPCQHILSLRLAHLDRPDDGTGGG